MAKPGRGRPSKIKSDTLNDVPDRVQPTEKYDEEVSYSDELPEFFKIYKPAICAQTMKIPPDFIKKFGENIPTIVTLRGQSGHSWQVDVKRINDNWCFQEGWPEFVQENSVEEDDFLTFCYSGKSNFFVKIFSRNGCIKRDDCTNGKPEENLQVNEASKPGNHKENRCRERNLTRKSTCKNPFFSVTLTSSYIHKRCLHIPREFGRVHLTEHKGRSTMVTLRIGNKSWAVRLIVRGDRAHFTGGWPQFVKDNSLQHGNLCTFQLIDWGDLAFRVNVDR